MRRVVITGLGAVTPIGNNVKELFDNLKKGKCGIDKITHYDTKGRKVKLAGEVKDFDPEKYIDKRLVRKTDRFTQFALAAASEAINDSNIFRDGELQGIEPDRIGVIVSSGIGGLETIQNEDIRGNEKGYDRISPFFIPMSISNMAAGQIAINYGIKGMCSCVVTACAGGTNAIGDAFHYIRDGYADIMVCGGAEASITELGIGGFTALKALSLSEDPLRASIPFDKERSGFVMGEGAGILVIEEYEHALARNAHIYCEVAGYSANCDANHITAPLLDGSVAAKCMKKALNDGGISGDKIDYINAHGTSTHLNDVCETNAIRTAFGNHADKLMVSSTKSMTGHLLGASGAVEGVILALSVNKDFVPPTINYKVKDEECDLFIVPNEGISTKVYYAMSDSLGFGGHNACIIFKKETM